MADPNSPNVARKPRPIAQPFGVSTDSMARAVANLLPPPGSNVQSRNALVPTPMGWLSPDTLATYVNALAPQRDDIANALGAPMDSLAWLARRFGARGIPGAPVETDPVMFLGNRSSSSAWAPSADVPLSSKNILRLFDHYIPKGGMF